MKPSAPSLMRAFKDRLIPLKQRNPQGRRYNLTPKQGNKDYYKGTGSANMGRHTKHGRYIIDFQKVRTYVVPEELHDTQLTPYAPKTLPRLINTYKGYQNGSFDGQWYIDKHEEYLKYGADESPESQRTENWIERP
ncbi:mitochondrial 54S ribosomal protein mL41 [Limtongia smithiae]|uniref:mitochondrial 54S ribosomal protein mL41 n=1 Tax=Limtongia smithiae TaxID=1125753 RepID=UPI0034CDB866